MLYKTVPNRAVWAAVDVSETLPEGAPVHHREWQLKGKMGKQQLASTRCVWRAIVSSEQLLSPSFRLEESWSRVYRCHFCWGSSSHQSCRSLYAAGWPRQSPPPPGCVLVRRVRTGTGWSSPSNRREQGAGRGGRTGTEAGGLERRTCLQLHRQGKDSIRKQVRIISAETDYQCLFCCHGFAPLLL